MTDPQIERLLEQMTPAEPTPALDARVAACLQRAAQSRPSRFGPMTITMVAALALVVGVGIGRWTGQNRSESAFGNTREAVQAEATVVSADSATDRVPETAVAPRGGQRGAATVRNVSQLSDRQVAAHFRGPRLGVLCGLPEAALDKTQPRYCLTCHQGLEDSKQKFLQQHAAQLSEQACSVCHRIDDPGREDSQAATGSVQADGHRPVISSCSFQRALVPQTGDCRLCHAGPSNDGVCTAEQTTSRPRVRSRLPAQTTFAVVW